MKFIFNSKETYEILNSHKNLLSKLFFKFICKVDKNNLQIFIKGNEKFLIYTIEIEHKKEFKQSEIFSINSEIFLKILRTSEKNNMEIEIFENSIKINNNFILQITKEEDEYIFNESDLKKDFSLTLKTENLKDCINFVKNSVSKEESRYFLMGVYIKCEDNKIKFVSTNGKILSYIEIEYPLEQEFSCMIPGDLIQNILKLNSEYITLTFFDSLIKIKEENLNLYSNFLESEFVDYKKVIPKFENYINLDKNSLLLELEKAGVFAVNKGITNINKINLKIDTNLVINSQNEFGKYKGKFIEIEKNSDLKFDGFFDYEFVHELLLSLDKKVTIFYENEKQPIKLEKNPSAFHIIAPMRAE